MNLKKIKIIALRILIILCTLILELVIFVLFFEKENIYFLNILGYGLLIIILNLIFCFSIVYFWTERFILKKVKKIYYNLFTKKENPFQNFILKDIDTLLLSIKKYNINTQLEIKTLKIRENYRKEFIGNISHELKTPLFTLQSYILTLIENPIKKKSLRQKYLKRANRAIERLEYIISDLDLIYQLESGIQKLKLKKFDIINLIKSVFENLEIEAEKKQIVLAFDQNYSPIYVLADKYRIQQVITNIIINSLKYGIEKGNTKVNISNYDEKKIAISINDNGIGIEKKHFSHLFERFYRVDKSGSRKTGGSGLGLAIVKHIIEGHKEKVFVESQLGIGSKFSFTLKKPIPNQK